MPIPGCNSSVSVVSSGTDATYSFLKSDSMILVKDNMGTFKNLPVQEVNVFTIQQGGVNVILDKDNLKYSTFETVNFNIVSNPSGSLSIYMINSDILDDSFYVDFSYLFNGNLYTNRWNVDVVKDGSDNASLVFSSADKIARNSDFSYSSTTVDIERVTKEVMTSGMFKYKGDVVRISFQSQSDTTTGLNNYVAVKIGSNNVYNVIFKYNLPQNAKFAGWYEITLTAINGSYTDPFLYNQQIQLNVSSKAIVGLADISSTNMNNANNTAINMLVNNTNLGSVQFVSTYMTSIGVSSISMWNFTIEKIPNQNII